MLALSRRRPLLGIAVIIIGSIILWNASAASASDVIIPINWDVSASTHIKSINLDVAVPNGAVKGNVDLTTGALTADVQLPPATTDLRLAGIPLLKATFALQEAAPITGQVDLATQTISVHASFNFLILKAAPTILPGLNLVGNHCHSAQPITVDFSGKVNLATSATFTAGYTIPKFADCGLLVTPILNLVAPGGGNTFTATFTPVS